MAKTPSTKKRKLADKARSAVKAIRKGKGSGGPALQKVVNAQRKMKESK